MDKLAKVQQAAIQPDKPSVEFPGMSENQVKLITDTIARGATPDELHLFLYTASKVGLDPLRGQIHAIKRYDSQLGREKMAIQTGIDGYRIIAERTGKYRGQTEPQWCGDDGIWVDVWLKKEPPAAARIGVLREGWDKPCVAIATYATYCQRKKDGNPTRMWSTGPDLMLAKCAEALALRKAFPDALAGLYTFEEMGQADSPEHRPHVMQSGVTTASPETACRDLPAPDPTIPDAEVSDPANESQEQPTTEQTPESEPTRKPGRPPKSATADPHMDAVHDVTREVVARLGHDKVSMQSWVREYTGDGKLVNVSDAVLHEMLTAIRCVPMPEKQGA